MYMIQRRIRRRHSRTVYYKIMHYRRDYGPYALSLSSHALSGVALPRARHPSSPLRSSPILHRAHRETRLPSSPNCLASSPLALPSPLCPPSLGTLGLVLPYPDGLVPLFWLTGTPRSSIAMRNGGRVYPLALAEGGAVTWPLPLPAADFGLRRAGSTGFLGDLVLGCSTCLCSTGGATSCGALCPLRGTPFGPTDMLG